MKKTFAMLTLAIALTVAAASGAQAFLGFGKYTEAKAVDGVVSIPLAEVNDGEAHYFRYDSGGKEIRFFVIKSYDGVIRAAFDACDVCFEAKKGYSQSGEFMICNSCGQKFHSSRINVVRGGCNPAPLDRSDDGTTLSISVASILQGARYF